MNNQNWVNDIHRLILNGGNPEVSPNPIQNDDMAPLVGAEVLKNVQSEVNGPAIMEGLTNAMHDTTQGLNKTISDIDRAFEHTIGTDWSNQVALADKGPSFEQYMMFEDMPDSDLPSIAFTDTFFQDALRGELSIRMPSKQVGDQNRNKVLGLSSQDPLLNSMTPELRNYLTKTAIQGSVTYKALTKGESDIEYDPALEAQLTFGQKTFRGIVSLGADLPIIMLGGGIPSAGMKLAGLGAKAVPFLGGLAAAPKTQYGYQIWKGAAGFGFYEGLRQVYNDKIVHGNIATKEDFIKRSGKAYLKTLEGMALGAVSGTFSYLREGQSVVNKSMSMANEAMAIATLQSQMNKPGTVPTKEDYAGAIATVFGLHAASSIPKLIGPTKRTPIQKFSDSVADEFVGRNPEAFEEYTIGMDNRWFADKFEKAYERYGVNPADLARVMEVDNTVLEDMTDPTKYNIRAFDRYSGAGEYQPDGVGELIEAINIGKTAVVEGSAFAETMQMNLKSMKSDPNMKDMDKILRDKIPNLDQQLADAADKEQLDRALGTQRQGGEADKGTAAGRIVRDEEPVPAMTSGTSLTELAGKPVHEVLGAEYLNPLRLKMGDKFFVVDAGEGKKLVVSGDYNKSLAASNGLMLQVPDAVSLLLNITGRFPEIKPELRDENGDPYYGHMARAEITRKLRLETVSKRIAATKRTITYNKNRGIDLPNMEMKLVELEQLRTDLKDTGMEPYQPDEVEVAISKKGMSVGYNPDGSAIYRSPVERDAAFLRTLTHEIGHVIDYMSADWEAGNSTIKDSLEMKFINYNDIVKGFMEDTGLGTSDASETLMKELRAISMLWRPTTSAEAFNTSDYRLSPEELFADFNSAMLSNPDLVKQVAPRIHGAWVDYIDSRPSARASVADLFQHLRSGESLQDAAATMMGEEYGFRKAEKLREKADQLMAASDSSHIEVLKDRFLNQVYDSAFAALRYINGDSAARNAIEKYQFVGTVEHNYVKRINKEFVEPSRDDLDLSNEEIGILLYHNRVMSDSARRELINSFGFSPKTSSLEFDRMYQEIMDKKGKDVNEYLDRFYKVRQETVVKMAEESGRFSDRMIETMKNNKEYARFNLLKYYERSLEENKGDNTGISSGGLLTEAEAALRAQKGSIEGIVNPLAATIENDLIMIKTIMKENAMEQVVRAMQENNGPVIAGPEWRLMEKLGKTDKRFDENQFDLLQKFGIKKSDMGKLAFLKRVPKKNKETGEEYMGVDRVEYWVPSPILDVFKLSPEFIQGYHKMVQADLSMTKGRLAKTGAMVAKTVDYGATLFRFFAITANVAFQTKNVAYDAGRTYMNAPRVEGKYVQSLVPGAMMYKHYGAAIKSQIRYVFGDGATSKYMNDMLEKGIVTAGSRYADAVSGADLSDTYIARHLDEVSRNAHITGKLGRAKQVGGDVVSFTDTFLSLTEGIQNEASYRFLKENQDKLVMEGGKRVGATDDEVDIMARGWMGSPAYMRRGKYSTIVNRAMPFTNTAIQATRGDVEAFKNDKSLFMAKAMISLIAPAIGSVLLARGFFDNKEKAASVGGTYSDILETQTSYRKHTSFNIPIFMDQKTGKGAVTSMPVPQHGIARLIYSSAYEMANSIVDAAEMEEPTANDALNMLLKLGGSALNDMTGQLPSVTPTFRVASGAYKILQGHNVESPYASGGDYLTREETARMNASDALLRWKERGKALATYSSDAFAVPLVSKVLRGNEDLMAVGEAMHSVFNPPPDADFSFFVKQAATIMGYPLGYAFSGYFNYDNGGIKEKLHELRTQDEAKAASMRILAESAVKDYQKVGKAGINADRISGLNIEKFAGAVKRAGKKGQIEAVQDPDLKMLLQYKSPSQQEYLKNRYLKRKNRELEQ